MRSSKSSDVVPPPCYAMVFPGLEEAAADEITRDLGGQVRKTGEGFVVFRPSALDRRLLTLRTVEDVFLLAWGTDQLSYRATDLDKIERWTAKEPDWKQLLQLHHAVHPKPKGKPTYRLVAQMADKHGYLRKHAREALAKGLAGHLPSSWKPADENAAVEVWLTIQGKTAFCGLRLSTRAMRHRTYKQEHVPASLRPSIAAVMARLAGIGPALIVADPMCGAGTIAAEITELTNARRLTDVRVLAGDCDRVALRAADANLRSLAPAFLARWDATRLPLANQCLDRIVSNPPFGKQLGDPSTLDILYRNLAVEYDRVLKAGGRAVLLASEARLLAAEARRVGWQAQRQMTVRVLGQRRDHKCLAKAHGMR